MVNGRLKELLIHPAFMALILTFILVLFIPPIFSKYRIKHIEDEYTNLNTRHIYSDLDSDGNSEKISFDLNDRGQTKIIVSKDNKILDQYNLKYHAPGITPAYFADYDLDGFKECFVLTIGRDSIFLSMIDAVKSHSKVFSDRFIDLRRKAEASDDTPQFNPIGMVESESKNILDFLFFINTGYSLQPRNVYRYSIAEDSLVKSPPSGAAINNCIISDINDDSQPEILLEVVATGNLDDAFPFSDKYSWFMVMDKDLKFLFPPERFSEYPSRLNVMPYRLKSKTRLIVFNDYYGTEGFGSAFYLYDLSGNKLAEKPIDDYEKIFSRLFVDNKPGRQTFYFLKNRDAEIDEMDSTFRAIRTFKIPAIESGDPLAVIDADSDGKDEYIFHGRGNRSLVITQNNFKDPVSLKYENNVLTFPFVSQVLKRGKKPELYLQFVDHGSYVRYFRNPFHYLKYPLYGIIYVTILAFIFLISRIQQYRLGMKRATEKKIAALQMKAIKNQIDPHFTLNIINAIGSLYATEENREKADYVFSKYARLIRQTVVSSDQIIVTLGEELDFVRNYIELEQFRCDNSFGYIIDIDEGVNKDIKIPRMLIYTFVENAIKYGIRNRTRGGFLKVAVLKIDNKCEILIEDNGPGLKSGKESDSGTSKGLNILNELIDLYFRLEKSKITYTLRNISGQGSRVEGTRASVELYCGG